MLYRTCCVDIRGRDVQELNKMIEGERDITRRTFLQYVNRESLRDTERRLGYVGHPSQGLTMAGDWHVSYHKSTYKGKPCVYFKWSSIEHIFY